MALARLHIPEPTVWDDEEEESMEATIIYGMARNISRTETLPVEEAFRMIRNLSGWAFIEIYYGDQMVYTTQGLAGIQYQCKDCPYSKMDGRTVTREQWKAIYNTRS